MSLEAMYNHWLVSPHLNGGDNSAFYQHMPTMRKYATGKCVVELGSRFGTSTLAILTGKPKWLLSVDIEKRHTINELEILANAEYVQFAFIEADDLKIEIPRCDILFIDTLHTYKQLSAELTLHGNKADEYIIFHDTISFGTRNEINDGSSKQGLWPAIHEFLAENTHWRIKEHYEYCNGLLVLGRVCN